MCNDKLYAMETDPCDFISPGFYNAKYILEKWVQTWPALVDYDGDPVTNVGLANTISADIVLDTTTYTDAAWIDFTLALDENNFDEEYTGKPGSGYYVTNMAGYVPGNKRINHWSAFKMSKSNLIMAIQTKDNEWRLFGAPGNPFQVRSKFVSGTQAGDRSGFEIIGLWAAHGQPGPFYDGAF